MENYVLNSRKRRVVSPEDVLVMRLNSKVDRSVYEYGVFCECGAELLIKNRKPFEPVGIECPECGSMIYLG